MMEILAGMGRTGPRSQQLSRHHLSFQVAIRRRLSGVVAAAFGISPAELESRARGRAEIARARQTAIYLARVVLRMTFCEAGRLYGRDRTTAAYACRVVEDLRDQPGFDRLLSLLEARLLSSQPAAIAGAPQ